MGVGSTIFSAKCQTHTVLYVVGVQCTVCMQYAVGVSAKGSTYTVGYAVSVQYVCSMQ